MYKSVDRAGHIPAVLPLVDQPKPLSAVGLSLVAVAKAMEGALVGASRYLTADMDLFANDNVFSRFQLVPTRQVNGQSRVGEAALTGASFSAMAGWCTRAFRVHDFLLGRANMLEYLRKRFILRGDNHLFDKWTAELRHDFAVDREGARKAITAATPRDQYYLPIIPVDDSIHAAVPDWPAKALDPNSIRDGLKDRLKAVLGRLREDNLSGFWSWLLGWVAAWKIASELADKLVGSFKDELVAAELWPKDN